MDSILDNLTFKQLIIIASANKYSRSTFKAYLRIRFNKSVKKYVQSKLTEFNSLMSARGGVVIGSIPRWIITPLCTWVPRNLNIVVPNSMAVDIVTFFTSIQYTLSTVRHGAETYCTPHIYPTAVYMLTHSDRVVTVTESRTKSVFPTILSTVDTSLAIIASPNGLIDFYPSLSAEGIRMCNNAVTTESGMEAASRQGMASIHNTVFWTVPCGSHCPLANRRISGLQDAAHVDWSIKPTPQWGDSMLDLANQNHYKWRLGNVCLNQSCPHFVDR